jgi:hypothetical protein
MRYSRKLGPHARRIVASHACDVVEGLVEISRSADPRRVKRDLERAGAQVFGLSRNTGYVRVEIPGDHLDALTKVSDVLYVEAEDLLHGVGS